MKIINDISYAVFDECKLDLYLPESSKYPIVIFFHGGGLENGNKSDNFDVFKGLTKNNIAVASANYRMYPEAKYPQFIEDAAAAAKWVSDNINSYGICTEIYIAGSSAGAYLAMMLCFDKQYLGKHGIDSNSYAGYIFDSAQPTTHFNILRERGFDTRKVVIDEAAPIYHICENPDAPRMMIFVSDNDMPNRLEQTNLFYSTLIHFGYNYNKIVFKLMKGYGHTEYNSATDEKGNNIFAEMIKDFIWEAL